MARARACVTAAAAAAAALLAGCSMAVDGGHAIVREEHRFQVAGEPEVVLATFDGSIRVQSWDRNEVFVEVEKRGPTTDDAAALRVETRQDGNRVRIEAPGPERWIATGGGLSVSYVVSVPRDLRLRVESDDGSVDVANVRGSLQIDTGDGSVRGAGLGGEISVHTGDGSISLTDASGRVAASTGDGSVGVDGRLEVLTVHTGDGSVRVEAVDGSTVAAPWTIATGDGSIVLRLPGGVNAELDAETADGRAQASGAGLSNVRRDEGEERWVRARLGNGGPVIRIRSGDGSVQVSTR